MCERFFFEFLGQYSKFHEVDLAFISQFRYKQEATTYESFPDNMIWSTAFLLLYKKAVMPKQKVIVDGTLKI